MPVFKPAVMTVARKPRDPPSTVRLELVRQVDCPKKGAEWAITAPEETPEEAGRSESADLLAAV